MGLGSIKDVNVRDIMKQETELVMTREDMESKLKK